MTVLDNLTNKDKVALAKQFNLIVRAINDFQINNWVKRDEDQFRELIKKEKEILFFVERLLDRSTNVLHDAPSILVVEVENFSEDLKMQLKYSTLDQALNIVSRTILLASSIFGCAPSYANANSDSFVEFLS